MKLVKYILYGVFFFCFSSFVDAQTSRAQQLYDEGLAMQKTLTIKSQKSAIELFKRAKVAFNETDKKKNCETQISICKKNIERIAENSRKKTNPPSSETIDKQEQEEQLEQVPTSHQPVELSLSPTQLEFKYKAKENKTIVVSCNYDDWEVVAYPEWLKVYAAPNEVSVIPEENTGDARSGILTVRCREKEVDVVINQSKIKGLNKIIKKVTGK